MFAKRKPVNQSLKEKSDERKFIENVLKPLRTATVSPSSEDLEENSFKDSIRNATPVASKKEAATKPTPVVISVKCNTNDTVMIEKRESRRGYKVLAIKDDGFGRKTIFDILDGTVYNCSVTNKMTSFAPIFDSKTAALSERCLSFKVDKMSSSKYPRILASFDCWGKCLRRLGGGSSTIYEHVRFIKIEEFLDPPASVPTRLSERYIEPFFFNLRDRNHVPNRQRADRSIRVDHW
eukprot:CAMPEP_0170072614 /NCGR_PEP_ID=MMETSP0019_2-20121128/10221_1 /TAXON_ID=98059 /ORGANISM="Dinobryon sp., Strain UTEXLB2267" /LENGTH=235 /DNA_ID=CAMNT_0010281699 /DNA_START=1399 /DNA_END=2103 /DNA_ORIENTATION=+